MISKTTAQQREKARNLLWRWGHARDMCREKAQKLREFKELSEQAKELPLLCEGAMDFYQRRCAAEFAFGRRMTELIAALPPRLQTILWMRYSGNSSFLRIALRMNLSVDRVKRLERDAVDLLLAMPGCLELFGGDRT
jgi:DNA-directed RNA polymerase specialized sigma24 family protein